ncbi:hypothetical protein RFH55_03710 [Cutibacterium avidum]|uniref:hypothetical protein n=1 Tax=Cutibacterium avidum TaxID=33010 RepID=UPI002095179C|nr:hypothetical protein [Cutibacterium avidum]MCO6633010.1 hypothetical protein [Cutibacterium avidum]MDQ9074657.1 hypothetical protein [Cutibacterium avidum]MDU4679085.1 hypothetical protein [Cutibacterium avidum]MDU5547360.1 hypothetical protein [Cutibacterium avidum]
MLSMGLSAADVARFETGLLADHRTRVLVQVLDLDHNVVSEANDVVLSGSVDVDATAEVSRTCQMEIWDPTCQLNLDQGAGPAQAALYADRMVQVHYCVWSDELPRWVNVPVFTGPITSLKRSRETLSLTAKGKESMLQTGQNRWWSFPAGAIKTTAIKNVLSRSGERHQDIPHWSSKLSSPLSITSQEPPWPVLQRLARSLSNASRGTDPTLYYNGAGWCRLRSYNRSSRWTFRRGVDFLSKPDLTFNVEATRNIVAAHGAKGVSASAKLPASDPLSAQSLSRGGVERWLLEVISNDGWTSKASCAAAARQRLNQLRTAAVQMELETVCIPHLEDRDVVTIDAGDWTWRMQLMKFSIPLDGSSSMQIGRTVTTRRLTRRHPVKRKGPRR